MSTQRPPADAIDTAVNSLTDPDQITFYTVEQDAAVGSQTEWLSANIDAVIDLKEAR